MSSEILGTRIKGKCFGCGKEIDSGLTYCEDCYLEIVEPFEYGDD